LWVQVKSRVGRVLWVQVKSRVGRAWAGVQV
jgi:hypothetical protein